MDQIVAIKDATAAAAWDALSSAQTEVEHLKAECEQLKRANAALVEEHSRCPKIALVCFCALFRFALAPGCCADVSFLSCSRSDAYLDQPPTMPPAPQEKARKEDMFSLVCFGFAARSPRV
jgi:hypothetical protein